MANRHLSRISVMQSLYEVDLRPSAKVKEVLDRNIKEKEDAGVDEDYIRNITEGVLGNIPEIDKKIADSAPEWPLEQIARVDKNILRVAIFELLYAPKDFEVPPKVAIDEAVEIAKAFGGENSSKFVNGVLGTIYRGSDKYDESEDTKKPKKIASKKSSEKTES